MLTICFTQSKPVTGTITEKCCSIQPLYLSCNEYRAASHKIDPATTIVLEWWSLRSLLWFHCLTDATAMLYANKLVLLDLVSKTYTKCRALTFAVSREYRRCVHILRSFGHSCICYKAEFARNI